MPFNSVGRSAVLYRLTTTTVSSNPIKNRAFIDVEYSRQLVFTKYAGLSAPRPRHQLLPLGGGQVNGASLRDITKKHAILCAFMMAAEYQGRFGKWSRTQAADCSP